MLTALQRRHGKSAFAVFEAVRSAFAVSISGSRDGRGAIGLNLPLLAVVELRTTAEAPRKTTEIMRPPCDVAGAQSARRLHNYLRSPLFTQVARGRRGNLARSRSKRVRHARYDATSLTRAPNLPPDQQALVFLPSQTREDDDRHSARVTCTSHTPRDFDDVVTWQALGLGCFQLDGPFPATCGQAESMSWLLSRGLSVMRLLGAPPSLA